MGLKSPYTYFGGKSKIAPIVWNALGNVKNYVEPFFGSGACLLSAPWPANRIETVNDKDGFISNFWRALQSEPEAVAEYADWPVNENDLTARHYWLIQQKESMQTKLEGDPHYYDIKAAGWWVWGISAWIGGGWCAGYGPWRVINGEMVNGNGNKGMGINRQRPHLGDKGMGINRKLALYDYMTALADRMRKVRVCCGDWSRVCGSSVTYKHGLTGVFLDPPYSVANRSNCYTVDDYFISHSVRDWAIENGDNQLMRIVLCGYEDEHKMPDNWIIVKWSANGGFDKLRKTGTNQNKHMERLWLSPHCLTEATLFDYATGSTTLAGLSGDVQ